MLASAAFFIGIILGLIALFVTRRREQEGLALKPGPLGWWTLAFGLIALAAFTLSVVLTSSGANPGSGPFLVSIAFGFAAVVAGVGSYQRLDHHWPTMVGLAAGLGLAIFWILFAAGNVFGIGK